MMFTIMNTIMILDLLNISIHKYRNQAWISPAPSIITVLGCFYIISGSFCWSNLQVFHANSCKITI